MKKIYLLITGLILLSCTEPKYECVAQEIIDGKVSHIGDNNYTPCLIWVQTPTETKMVKLPNEYRSKFKVGDSCFLIIQKYKIIKEE